MTEEPTMPPLAWRRTSPDERDDWTVGGGLDYCRVYRHAGDRWFWCVVRQVIIGSGLEETKAAAMAEAKARWTGGSIT